MQPLDPLVLPLRGCLLLEASAGTGKTYTLALLVLRLLLEQGLAVDQILVVTFTRAATGELRDRIRRRLREALDALTAEEQGGSDDPLLQGLLDRVEPELARQRLADALVRMDEAAIHTIHGYCQRVLQEHAFASATPFSVELMENDQSLRQEIIEDFWRNHFYPASDEEAAWALVTWGAPAGLLKALGRAASAECQVLPEVDAEAVARLEVEAGGAFAAVQSILRQDQIGVERLLRDDGCLLRNDKAYRLNDRVEELCATMTWMAGLHSMPLVLPAGLEKLSGSVMAGHLKKKCAQPPEHPLFVAMDQWLPRQHQLLLSRRVRLLNQACAFLRQELARRKERLGLLAFDDLLHRLDAALARPGSGARLAADLRQQYPVALVDEFQDTDPVQYRIFSRIYRQQGGLCMIGDPKQAIYSFRGADIFTYMQARRHTPAEQRFTMTTNYRSTPAMVAAINALFGRRQASFVFAEAIAFQPVSAASGRAAPLLVDGQSTPPLIALLLDDAALKKSGRATISIERAQAAAVDCCAAQIVQLLEAARLGQASIGGHPVTTADIAILVRSHREAEAMQAGLRRRGINALALGQHSVFTTAEAGQLLQVLRALAEGSDPGRIRTALASELFGCDAATILALREDEQAWAARLVQVQQYRQMWQEQGFLAMFQHLLVREGVTARLTGRIGGERSLTNYLHLAELFQESPAGQHGAAALLRWLQHQIDNPDAGSEAQLIRLENDEQLIRIVTVHRAKGLEFPVVFAPFLWHGRPLSKDGPLQFHRRDDGQLCIDWAGEAAHRSLAEEERLAEELRLLYVALTRAKSCCFFCWGLVSGLEHTALAYLLHQGQRLGDEIELRADVKQLNTMESLVELRSWPTVLPQHRLSMTEERQTLGAKPFTGRILPGWTMTSYSRLSSEVAVSEAGEQEESRTVLVPLAEDFRSPLSFPRGSAAGTCLHNLLERLECHRPATDQQSLIAEVLEQGGIDGRWQGAVAQWLEEILAVELPGACTLGEIAPQDRINELNFLFPLEEMDMHRFAVLLAEAGFRAPEISQPRLRGLMKGFIDLVFRFQGRFFLVDYKSNYLGPNLVDYGPEALEACMDSHQYHLQLLIYSLALHRFLSARLADYDYDRHFGGACYCFLRAMGPMQPPPQGIYALRPERQLILTLDDCCRGGRG